MGRKLVKTSFIIIFLACFLLVGICQAQTHSSDWTISSDWGGTSSSTPAPVNLNVTIPEMILLILFSFFTTLAFATREPFIFGISGFLSIISGIYFGMQYLDDVNNWMMGLVGALLFFFGLFMLVLAVQFAVKEKGGTKK